MSGGDFEQCLELEGRREMRDDSDSRARLIAVQKLRWTGVARGSADHNKTASLSSVCFCRSSSVQFTMAGAQDNFSKRDTKRTIEDKKRETARLLMTQSKRKPRFKITLPLGPVVEKATSYST